MATPAIGAFNPVLGVLAGAPDLYFDIVDAAYGRTSPVHAAIDVVGMGAGPAIKMARRTKPIVDDIVSHGAGAVSFTDDAL